MSDFKNISDFRKSKTSQYPYQDPTYLSFVLMFDFNDRVNSPLFSGPAEEFLEKLTGDNYYAEKLTALREFKKALTAINRDMPWYWQSIAGLEVLQQWDPSNPYFGKDDAKLTISTLESLNLPIAGLMYLYRKATFDERKWTWVLPENLRRFRMYVYVTEVRKIKNLNEPTSNGINNDEYPNNLTPRPGTTNKNNGITGQQARPYFMFALTYCEFDLTSGTTPFADLQKNPTESATNEIAIKYEALQHIGARVLNGIIEETDSNNISPAPESETESRTNVFEQSNKSKFNQRIDELKDRAKQDLDRLSRQKKNEIEQVVRDATINRIPSIDNIYQKLVQGLDNATDLTQQTRNIGANIRDNVYGDFARTAEQRIQDALNEAANNSLGNVFD